MVGIPALVAGEFIALPFAVGCGFAGGGLREACPKEAIWRFTAVHLHRSASAGVADRAPPRGQLADRAARRDRGARIASAGARSPVHRRPPLLFGLDSAVGDGTGGGRHRTGRGDAHQDLEHGAHRAPPAGAGKTAPGGQGGGAEESDQPALPLQHPRVDLVSHSHAARNRADAESSSYLDCSGGLSEVISSSSRCAKSSNRSTSTSPSKSSDSGQD